MRVLVIAEHDQQNLRPATHCVVSSAIEIGGEIHVLVAGNACDAVVAQAAALDGVSRVLVVQSTHYLAQTTENLAELIISVASDYTHIMMAATSFGKRVLPRLAALLDVEQVSDICAVVSPDTFVRPIYAGNALETVQSGERMKVVSVRAAAFDAVGEGAGPCAEIERLAPLKDTGLTTLLSRELNKSQRVELDSAHVVVAGGRGLGSAESFSRLLVPLSEKLNAAIGASYGAVNAGYAPNDLQIGQTGKIIAPDLYIAVGISGAIQHLAGVKGAKVIVAINKDPEAPICKVADYVLLADLFEAVPALLQVV